MEVRRFVASTFEEACQHIKDELGPEALIISTQRLRVGGFLGLFRKKVVEVIAARVAGAVRQGALATDAHHEHESAAQTASGPMAQLAPAHRPAPTLVPAPLPGGASIPHSALSTTPAWADPSTLAAGPAQAALLHSPVVATAAPTNGHTVHTVPAPAGSLAALAVAASPASIPSQAVAHAPPVAPAMAPQADTAASIAGDLGLIRSELLELRRRLDALALAGPSAALLSASTCAPGNSSSATPEIALENAENPGAARIAATRLDQAPVPVGPLQAKALQSVIETLQRHEVEAPLLEQIRQHLLSGATPQELEQLETLRERVVEFLSRQVIRHEEIGYSQGQKGKIIALIGPPGDGKTTTLAKLAAGFKLNMNLKVAMVTVDTYRLGAPQQLQAYADIIQAPCEVVYDPAALPAVVNSLTDFDVILVDTAGRNARNAVDMHDLRNFLDVGLPIEVCLVLSATTKLADSVEMAELFNQLSYSRVIMTKLDETSTFGSMLSLLGRIQKPVSYVTTGQNVPDDIVAAQPQRLANLLFADRPVF